MSKRRFLGMTFWTILFLSAGARMGLGEAKPAPQLRRVIIVFKTHFDIGYTDMARNVVDRYRTTMIDQALEVADENRSLPPERRFIWTLPGWPLAKISEDWEGQTPARRARVMQAFKEGCFVVHALPFTMHTELLELEDLVRGMGFASRLSREAGLPLPRDAKMTDVPSHTWILPTLLHQAGVEFLHLGCNAASSSPRVPPLFFWEGPDGSRLLTMYSAAGYGTGLIPPAEWPYRTWLALIHTGDNQGPPTPGDVKKLLDEAAVKLAGVDVRIGRLSDFADALLAEKAEIPIIRGDMPDTWIHGPMADPAGAKLARRVRPEIGTAEALGTLLGMWGARTFRPAGAIAKAYEDSLLYGEHTWGGALYWVTEYGKNIQWGYGDVWRADRAAGRFKRLEDSWAEHSAYIRSVRDIISPLLADEIQGLALAVNVPGRRVVVFNPLPWKRGGLVKVDVPGTAVSALRAVDGGDIAAAETADGALHFVARNVPALGYRVYVPVSAGPKASELRADKSTSTIENRWLRIELDPAHGAIRSLVDKRSGRELVGRNSPQGFGQYLYERFDADDVARFVKAYVKIDADWGVTELGKPPMPPSSRVSYHAASPANCSLEFEKTATSVAAILSSQPSASLGHGVTTRVTLYPDEPFVDFEITLHDKPADAWPEAGWIVLPLNVVSPAFRLGRVGSIVDPAKDVVRGTNRHLFAVNTGVAVFDPQGRGVGVSAPDSPLVSLDTPGCWKYSLDFLPKKPVVFINLFNNQWSTNFRLWNEGTWTARVRLWAFEAFVPESSLITPSLETRYPLLAAAADGTAGKLPAEESGLKVSAAGTLVTAFGPNPDGPGTILRLWELAGKSGRCAVRLPDGMDVPTVQPVDLRGRALGKPLTVKSRAFSFDLHAFAPASFVLPDGR